MIQQGIILFNYGMSTRYLDSQGQHLKDEVQGQFIGNIALASVHSMEFHRTSRRDDFISLCYLLILMLDGYVDFLNIDL